MPIGNFSNQANRKDASNQLPRKFLMGIFVPIVGVVGAIVFSTSASADCVQVDQIQNATAQGTYVTCGGDDISYRVPILDSVIFGGITYNDVFATTNSVITFGSPDGTWSDFPPTPGISFQSLDWVAGVPGSPYWWNSHPDEFFNITTTNSGFVVELQGRYYWTYPNGELIHNILAFVRNPDGTLNIQSFTSSSETQHRNGCRLQLNGPIVDFETCGITQQVSLLAITELVEQISNNTVPAPPVEEIAQVVEDLIKDPTQQSKTDSISPKMESDDNLIVITIHGNFIETVRAIAVNAKNVPDGSWIQTPSTVTFSARKSQLSTYKVQVFNGSVPVVAVQSFTITG